MGEEGRTHRSRAEEVLAAEKLGRKIAVEIKSFIGPSEMQDLQQALGQFVIYRAALEASDQPERELLMAVAERVYFKLFSTVEGRALIGSERLRIIVFDPQT